MAKKTWIEKRDANKTFQIKTIDKRFADMPEGCRMLIATPKIVDDYVRCIQPGNTLDMATMRNDLAIEYNAEKTCPVTSGIYLRTVAEAALEELEQGKELKDVTPFWRIITPDTKLAKKLSCGVERLQEFREND